MSLDNRQALLHARLEKAMKAYGTALFTFYEYFKAHEGRASFHPSKICKAHRNSMTVA